MKLLTVSEVTRRVRRTPETVKRWVDLGLLPCTRTESGTRIFTADAVETFISERHTVRDQKPGQ